MLISFQVMMNTEMNMLADKKSYWLKMIEEQEDSGLSQTAFCKEKNLKTHQFYYYLRLLKNENVSEVGIKNKVVPIQIKPVATTSINLSKEIRLILQNDVQCILPIGIPIEQIEQLLKVILSC